MTDSTSRHRPLLLVVGGGPFQLDILATARALDISTFCVDGDANAPGLAIADDGAVVSTADSAAVLELARRLRPDGVVTCASDVSLPAVAAVVDALGLHGPSTTLVENCADKLRTFDRLAEADLRTPLTLPIESLSEALASVDALGGYPVVVKPRSAAGGRGVAVVAQPDDWSDHLKRARQHDTSGRGAIVQSFADGVSIGVEAFFSGGALRAHIVMNDQHRAEFVSPIGHSLPFDGSEDDHAEAGHFVSAVARVVGLRDGAANFDLKRDAKGYALIEVNPRQGGNSITELARRAYGIDLSAASVAAALGRDPLPHLAARPVTPVASRLLLAPATRSPRRPDAARRAALERSGVDNIDLYIDESGRSAVVNGWALLGSCLVHADTAANAEALAAVVAADIESAACSDEPAAECTDRTT